MSAGGPVGRPLECAAVRAAHFFFELADSPRISALLAVSQLRPKTVCSPLYSVVSPGQADIPETNDGHRAAILFQSSRFIARRRGLGGVNPAAHHAGACSLV